MGIQDLSPRLRQPSERPDSLDDPRLRGQRVGVDVSKYLHRATSSKIGAEQAMASPRVPVTQVEVVLSALLAACRKQVGETGISRGITPVFVFDGVRPSVKSLEDRRRAKEQVGAEAQLAALYAKGNASDLNEVTKLRKRPAKVTEDVVAIALPYLRAQAARCSARRSR